MKIKKEVSRIKSLSVPNLAACVIFIAAVLWSLMIGLVIHKSVLTNSPYDDITVLVIVGSISIPLLLFVLFAKKAFSIVTIDETGIHSALFGKFFKRKMTWNEIHIQCYRQWTRYYFTPMMKIYKKTSKNVNRSWSKKLYDIGVDIDARDSIEIQFTEKRLNVISRYIPRPVTGLDTIYKNK
ncbi:MAG: hypothetical protein HDT28_05410 [Clostridiales bacterium]|nr:hypothetical protein [Clostridiales bacterium]